MDGKTDRFLKLEGESNIESEKDEELVERSDMVKYCIENVRA